MELLLLIIILALPPSSSPAFTPQTSYFLACGSSVAASLAGDTSSRTFLPDAPYLIDPSTSTTVTNAGGGGVYPAARRFISPATYRFTIKSSDTYVIRLHFVPTSPLLSNATFSVSVSDRFLLLSSFTPRTQQIKEFLLHADADAGPLDLLFTPSPLAFVNAIELFTAPRTLLPSSSAPQPVGGARPITDLPHQALETIFRVNVGGPKVTPANDALWRTWTPDDPYLTTNTTSFVNSTSKRIVYQDYKGRSEEIAPPIVYSTARTMAVTPDLVFGSNQGFHFNVSWSFPVPPGFLYLVRLHFCDIISATAAELYFDVYLGDDMAAENLHPDDYTDGFLASPFYLDYAAYPSGSGLVNVSIGRASMDIAANKVNAILNGIEIMKVNNSGGSLDGGSFLTPAQPSKKKRSHLAIIVSSAIGGLVLLAALLFTLFVVCKKPRRRAGSHHSSSPKQPWSPFAPAGPNSSMSGGVSTQRGTSPISNLALGIPFAEIKRATQNFADELVIGLGGFGKVYRGVLSNGTTVAVKRAKRGSRQGYPEFQAEIIVLSSIRHRHLVSLVGYCDEQSEMILVYEYMEKGPLKDYLHGSGSAELPCLSWKQRLEICIGAARGLHYLHTGYSDNIIHRDIKSTNILLGENYLSKVSDFGLSRQGPSRGETHVSTAVKGTFGYLDPEYFKIQKLTDKSDVYSFGVLLFEVLCARPATDQTVPREQISLAEWALQCQQRGALDRIADPRLAGKINRNSMRTFGETAAKCLAESGVDRPTMADVLWNLEYALQLQMTEVRREPHEDSGKVESGIQVAVPLRRVVGEEEMSSGSELTTNNVFSQLINDEGR